VWSANNDRQRFPWLDVVFHSKTEMLSSPKIQSLLQISGRDCEIILEKVIGSSGDSRSYLKIEIQTFGKIR
jgi:hypothetical protein